MWSEWVERSFRDVLARLVSQLQIKPKKIDLESKKVLAAELPLESMEMFPFTYKT